MGMSANLVTLRRRVATRSEVFYRAECLDTFINLLFSFCFMNGVISHFRGSFRRKKGNHIIVILPGVDKKDKAQSYIGKSAVWTAQGKNKTQINGKIAATHGNKGAVRVIFERGLPGQSLGTEVKIG